MSLQFDYSRIYLGTLGVWVLKVPQHSFLFTYTINLFALILEKPANPFSCETKIQNLRKSSSSKKVVIRKKTSDNIENIVFKVM